MNGVLAVVVLYICAVCNGSRGGWERQNIRPMTNTPRAHYSSSPSRTPLVQHEYTKYGEPLGWNEDRQLLQQRQSGNQEAQCPCVIRPGTNTCITYDLRFQAATLTEAVYGFPDLTIDIAWQSGAPANTAIAGSKNFDCNTKECQLCVSRMTQKLREVGLMNRPVPGLNISQSSSASSIDYCAHYRFDYPKRPSVATVQPTRTSSASSSEESRIRSEVEWLAQMGRENYRKKQMNGASSPTPSPRPSDGRSTTTGSRGKRQTARPNAASILGTRFNISCAAKGEVVEDSGDRLMSLCTTCWAWRRLPDNYFPQFINELICDARDNVCLSGWASCSQSYRTLSVLRQHTNGTWEPVSIQAGACCECKVLAGSALNSLVVGLGMSGSLAANRSP